jgi:chloramphenicol 3-O-phosphotransferase
LLSGALSGIVRDPRLRAEVQQTLAPLHAVGDLDSELIGVNGPRVDVLVRTSDDEWRLVFFSADGRHVDAVAVFRRPPRFEGVPGGRAVVVNGPSGAGKSMLIQSLQARGSEPWIVFDEPTIGHVDQAYLIWRDRAPVMHRGFLEAIAAVARAGNYVATSAAGLGQAIFDDVFAGVPLIRVGLECDLATLLQREGGRDGRRGGLAAASLDDHRGWDYHATFDTTQLTSDQMAAEVLDLVANLTSS